MVAVLKWDVSQTIYSNNCCSQKLSIIQTCPGATRLGSIKICGFDRSPNLRIPRIPIEMKRTRSAIWSRAKHPNPDICLNPFGLKVLLITFITLFVVSLWVPRSGASPSVSGSEFYVGMCVACRRSECVVATQLIFPIRICISCALKLYVLYFSLFIYIYIYVCCVYINGINNKLVVFSPRIRISARGHFSEPFW